MAARRAMPARRKITGQSGVVHRRGFSSPSNILTSEGSEVGIELALRVHDGLIDVGSARGQAGNGHEVAFARRVQGGAADGVQILAEVFNQLRSDFRFHDLSCMSEFVTLRRDNGRGLKTPLSVRFPNCATRFPFRKGRETCCPKQVNH
jgi:hypothetical protein